MDSISIYLIVPIAAWVVAQLLKVLLGLQKPAPSTARRLFASGSMPSAHAAIVVALLAVVGARDGIDSALFGIVGIFSAIVLYDAVYVRRAVGEQGKVLAKLVDKKFFTAEGHRIPDIVVGAAIGVIVAFILLQIL